MSRRLFPVNRAQFRLRKFQRPLRVRLLDLGAFRRSSARNPDTKPTFSYSTSLLRPAIWAQIALTGKNPAAASNALPAPAPIELGQISFVTNMYCVDHVYVRGEAYLAAGQGSAAAVEFQKILDHGGIVWIAGQEQWLIWEWLAPMHCSRRSCSGRMPTPTASARSRRTKISSPDEKTCPDIPILKKAKAEYTKLQQLTGRLPLTSSGWRPLVINFSRRGHTPQANCSGVLLLHCKLR